MKHSQQEKTKNRFTCPKRQEQSARHFTSHELGGLTPLSKLILILLPLLSILLALSIGRMGISVTDIYKSICFHITGHGIVNQQIEIVLWTIRFPRILLAMLVGAGLSVAGCTFQSLFSNPLATPDTLGVASGASFGAAFGILLGFSLLGVQVWAFLCGLIAILLTYLSVSNKGNKVNSIVLAGIMIGSLFTALVSLIKYVADTDTQLPAITYWLMGSISSANYKSLSLGAPLILLGILLLFLIRWRMNLLPLPEDEANASGTNMKQLRVLTILCATAITASCVSMCGQVGWVGLLIPHICRMRFGNNHLALIPSSISVGASFLVIVDVIARSATASEIPISILTAIIGAPFFILLMRKSGGWNL